MADADDWAGQPVESEYDGFNDFSMDDVDASSIGSGAVKVDREGWYHFGIADVVERPLPHEKDDMSKSRRPDILVTCDVLHAVNGQSGKGAKYFHSVILGGKGVGATIEGWAKEATLNFLVGIGVLKNSDGRVIDPETGGPRINSRTLAARIKAVGQFIGHIKLNKSDDPKYADKYELNYGRGAYRVDDPQVAHVAKNVEALAAIGKTAAAAPAAAATSAQGPPATQQKQQQAGGLDAMPDL